MKCAACGREYGPSGRVGRPSKFCSTACRKAMPRTDRHSGERKALIVRLAVDDVDRVHEYAEGHGMTIQDVVSKALDGLLRGRSQR